MNLIISITVHIFLSIGQLWAQENLDFLDKVNEKPKTTIPAKIKEEPVTTNKKLAVTTSKKKKSKKKKNASLVTDQNTIPQNVNPIVPTVNPVINELKPPLIVEPVRKAEEELVFSGMWIDPEVVVEPDGLPGFGSDVAFGRNPNVDSSSAGSQLTSSNKPLFNFSDFFDKYKKAMLILGIIILFAFYRLRLAKPSSNSKPYRR
jgi:Sec region non-globular protein